MIYWTDLIKRLMEKVYAYGIMNISIGIRFLPLMRSDSKPKIHNEPKSKRNSRNPKVKKPTRKKNMSIGSGNNKNDGDHTPSENTAEATHTRDSALVFIHVRWPKQTVIKALNQHFDDTSMEILSYLDKAATDELTHKVMKMVVHMYGSFVYEQAVEFLGVDNYQRIEKGVTPEELNNIFEKCKKENKSNELAITPFTRIFNNQFGNQLEHISRQEALKRHTITKQTQSDFAEQVHNNDQFDLDEIARKLNKIGTEMKNVTEAHGQTNDRTDETGFNAPDITNISEVGTSSSGGSHLVFQKNGQQLYISHARTVVDLASNEVTLKFDGDQGKENVICTEKSVIVQHDSVKVTSAMDEYKSLSELLNSTDPHYDTYLPKIPIDTEMTELNTEALVGEEILKQGARESKPVLLENMFDEVGHIGKVKHNQQDIAMKSDLLLERPVQASDISLIIEETTQEKVTSKRNENNQNPSRYLENDSNIISLNKLPVKEQNIIKENAIETRKKVIATIRARGLFNVERGSMNLSVEHYTSEDNQALVLKKSTTKIPYMVIKNPITGYVDENQIILLKQALKESIRRGRIKILHNVFIARADLTGRTILSRRDNLNEIPHGAVQVIQKLPRASNNINNIENKENISANQQKTVDVLRAHTKGIPDDAHPKNKNYVSAEDMYKEIWCGSSDEEQEEIGIEGTTVMENIPDSTKTNKQFFKRVENHVGSNVSKNYLKMKTNASASENISIVLDENENVKESIEDPYIFNEQDSFDITPPKFMRRVSNKLGKIDEIKGLSKKQKIYINSDGKQRKTYVNDISKYDLKIQTNTNALKTIGNVSDKNNKQSTKTQLSSDGVPKKISITTLLDKSKKLSKKTKIEISSDRDTQKTIKNISDALIETDKSKKAFKKKLQITSVSDQKKTRDDHVPKYDLKVQTGREASEGIINVSGKNKAFRNLFSSSDDEEDPINAKRKLSKKRKIQISSRADQEKTCDNDVQIKALEKVMNISNKHNIPKEPPKPYYTSSDEDQSEMYTNKIKKLSKRRKINTDQRKSSKDDVKLINRQSLKAHYFSSDDKHAILSKKRIFPIISDDEQEDIDVSENISNDKNKETIKLQYDFETNVLPMKPYVLKLQTDANTLQNYKTKQETVNIIYNRDDDEQKSNIATPKTLKNSSDVLNKTKKKKICSDIHYDNNVKVLNDANIRGNIDNISYKKTKKGEKNNDFDVIVGGALEKLENPKEHTCFSSRKETASTSNVDASVNKEKKLKGTKPRNIKKTPYKDVDKVRITRSNSAGASGKMLDVNVSKRHNKTSKTTDSRNINISTNNSTCEISYGTQDEDADNTYKNVKEIVHMSSDPAFVQIDGVMFNLTDIIGGVMTPSKPKRDEEEPKPSKSTKTLKKNLSLSSTQLKRKVLSLSTCVNNSLKSLEMTHKRFKRYIWAMKRDLSKGVENTMLQKDMRTLKVLQTIMIKAMANYRNRRALMLNINKNKSTSRGVKVPENSLKLKEAKDNLTTEKDEGKIVNQSTKKDDQGKCPQYYEEDQLTLNYYKPEERTRSPPIGIRDYFIRSEADSDSDDEETEEFPGDIMTRFRKRKLYVDDSIVSDLRQLDETMDHPSYESSHVYYRGSTPSNRKYNMDMKRKKSLRSYNRK
ncbi:hypothetical protein GWI33_015362 [Rhynchophorus ferrugineus]|uniref:Uncharacterized protein n=1 Tax=Rhynchophorus ferrugineus TaxID=354439 RepID=A0A834I2R6_RHYFE|nr:hypothetical protein GWI33_015362 [Rhynchophorus ferrugineus]